jgi:aryl-alcohol dehydrogenase-like predicted oxidoreductase
VPDSAITVCSLWVYTYRVSGRLEAPTHEVKDLSIDALKRQAIESHVILGPRLSLYQIHSATLDSGVLDDAAVLTELWRWRRRGVRIGVTVTGPHQADTIRRALDVRIDGVALFQTVQATWNLLEPSAGSALADASAEGCGVIVKEVLANGRLTDRFGGPELGEVRQRAASLGTAVETLAVAMALAQPWADVVLSGAVTCDQLQAHVSALDLDADLEPLAGLAEPPDLYWRRRGALPWN